MKKLTFLAVPLILVVTVACTVQQSNNDKCTSRCAGANAGEPSGGTTTGGTKADGGSPSETGGSSAAVGGDSAGNAAVGGDASNVAGAGNAPQLPTTVEIEIISALVGPGKIDGTQWDLTGKVPDSVVQGLSTALGYPEVGPLLIFVQGASYQALSKPDPYGIGEINTDGSGFDSSLNVNLALNSDNFQPTWPAQSAEWKDVQFRSGLQVRVTLYDDDLVTPDPIGIATLKYQDLVDAWLSQEGHWVRVEEQTNRQLLAVEIQVSGAVP